jgi:hypothetical protein
MVNNEMRHDWIVTGGLIAYLVDVPVGEGIVIHQQRTFFAQAMIKPTPQPH